MVHGRAPHFVRAAEGASPGPELGDLTPRIRARQRRVRLSDPAWHDTVRRCDGHHQPARRRHYPPAVARRAPTAGPAWSCTAYKRMNDGSQEAPPGAEASRAQPSDPAGLDTQLRGL